MFFVRRAHRGRAASSQLEAPRCRAASGRLPGQLRQPRAKNARARLRRPGGHATHSDAAGTDKTGDARSLPRSSTASSSSRHRRARGARAGRERPFPRYYGLTWLPAARPRASCSLASRANYPPPASAAHTARISGSATPCASAAATATGGKLGTHTPRPDASSSSRLPSSHPQRPGDRPPPSGYRDRAVRLNSQPAVAVAPVENCKSHETRAPRGFRAHPPVSSASTGTRWALLSAGFNLAAPTPGVVARPARYCARPVNVGVHATWSEPGEAARLLASVFR